MRKNPWMDTGSHGRAPWPGSRHDPPPPPLEYRRVTPSLGTRNKVATGLNISTAARLDERRADADDLADFTPRLPRLPRGVAVAIIYALHHNVMTSQSAVISKLRGVVWKDGQLHPYFRDPRHGCPRLHSDHLDRLAAATRPVCGARAQGRRLALPGQHRARTVTLVRTAGRPTGVGWRGVLRGHRRSQLRTHRRRETRCLAPSRG